MDDSPVPWHDHLSDKLRLALLKENSLFRDFWDIYSKEALAVIAEKNESEDIEGAYVDDFFGDDEIIGPFLVWLRSCGISTENRYAEGLLATVTALNPYNEISDNSPPQPVVFLTRHDPLTLALPDDADFFVEHYPLRRYSPHNPLELKTSERLFIIDIACRKSKIIEALENYLNTVSELREEVPKTMKARSKAPHGHDDKKTPFKPQDPKVRKLTLPIKQKDYKGLDEIAENYTQWNNESRRDRPEIWRHLKVWQLRRKRNSYLHISIKTGIRENNVKNSLARAYELIEGHPYDAERFTRAHVIIGTKDLRKPCDSCLQTSNCDPKNDPCPDLVDFYTSGQGAAYLRQVEVSQRHLLTKKVISKKIKLRTRLKSRRLDDY
ncbi:hypothetical protein [Desulfurivibrio sp. C05AmB]|uniref:hypothetical protein n=1 Tax=Desulfurivibrio sp. C05AmB TaxID=3374371 RepID=UPI00376F061F